jgi:ABC-type uncharacterized transport system permease subunit
LWRYFPTGFLAPLSAFPPKVRQLVVKVQARSDAPKEIV